MNVQNAAPLAATLAILFAACSIRAANRVQTRVILSDVYAIQGYYESMMGPSSAQDVFLSTATPPELFWITGFKTEMVGADGRTPMPEDFMCHANLDFADMARHRALFAWRKNVSTRIATLSQGQLSVQFPPGYGVPILSNEPLDLATQVLNFNHPGSWRVRHKVSISFVANKDARTLIKPLFAQSPFVMVSLDGKPEIYGVAHPTPREFAAACPPGRIAPNSMMDDGMAGSVYTDAQGRRYSGHFLVAPGRHVYRTLATRLMNLGFNTRVHYIEVHLHPFAQSLALRDLTSGQTLWTARAHERAKGVGLSGADFYSSASGFPLYKSHDYEIIAVYDNTSGENQDAMAVMTLFLEDKDYHRPAFAGDD